MRRRAATVLILAVIAAAFVGVWAVAYRMGESDGRDKVAADRKAYQTQAAGNAQSGATTGQPSGTARTRAAGSAAAETGTPSAGSPSSGRGPRGVVASPAASGTGQPTGAATTSITGHVTKIDGTTLSIQQTDATTVTVTTASDTAIRKLVSGALTDLKAGDLITVDGAKTGDTAYNATTITSLGQRTGGAGGARGRAVSTVSQGVPAPVVTGQITSVESGTITVQGFDGVTVTVTTSPATVVRTQQPGTFGEIKSGALLVVIGDKTGDTTLLARSITNQGAS
ncbi:MAG: DUF5666 domain-containing protein [Thermomicrobiales bacterium]